MHLSHYDFQVVNDALEFNFESISGNRRIQKLIEYRLIDEKSQLYNLALVDVDEDGYFSDLTISNNNDMPKVLATVAQTLLLFFRTRPQANVIFRGSTSGRTRLYRMAISKYLSEIEEEFIILGLSNTHFVPFQQNQEYEAFVVRLKEN